MSEKGEWQQEHKKQINAMSLERWALEVRIWRGSLGIFIDSWYPGNLLFHWGFYTKIKVPSFLPQPKTGPTALVLQQGHKVQYAFPQ